MRILLTRPEADARRNAARLAALGHDVVLAPLFDIVATRAPRPEGRFDRLLATSAHAFDAFPQSGASLTSLPLEVVGERTAAAARESGFTQVGALAADAKSLAIAIAREGRQRQSFLYLAGRERRPDLEASLAALGHEVTPWILYETREAESAGAQLAAIWREQRIDAALHFSARSAALYVALARKLGLVDQAMAPVQVAISPRAAESLSGAREVRIAPTPDLDGLLSCL